MPQNPWAVLQPVQPVDIIGNFMRARQQQEQIAGDRQSRDLRAQEVRQRDAALKRQADQDDRKLKTQTQADELLARLDSGDVDGLLSGQPMEVQSIVRDFLSKRQDYEKTRQELDLAHIKESADMAAALAYNPVVTEALFKLVGRTIPEAMQVWEQIKGDPAKVKAAVDRYRGVKEEGPVKLGPGDVLVPPTGGPPVASNPKVETPPRVTYGAPQTQVVNGQRALVRPGSDGKMYDMNLQPVDAGHIAPEARAVRGDGLTPNAALAQTRALRNDYQREVKAARTVTQQLSLMKSSLDAVKNGSSPAGSQGVLVTFQKILDPTSVVRESEYARSASGLSLLGRIEGAWLKLSQGGAGVGVHDLEQFVTLAEDFARKQQAYAAQTKTQIDAIAREYGLKPELITQEVAEPDEDTSGGVPQVGGTYNGGRVLSVTPVP